MTPLLPDLLATPLGRSTPVDADVQRQLTGDSGTLTTQLGRLLDRVADELRELLGVRPDVPPRRPHPWTLLTEHENPLWPMLALSRPPNLPPEGTARVARHLATAHLAMDLGRCRAWAQTPDPRESTEAIVRALEPDPAATTWLDLLCAVFTVQAHHLMLHSWGVLSAYVGLHTELRVTTARRLRATLDRHPALCTSPKGLAAELLWASLELLHGGLPFPGAAEAAELAQAMRTLPERTMTGPLPPALGEQLAELLPGLSGGARRELAGRLGGQHPSDPQQASTGLLALHQPGQTACWLRRAGEVQLIVCRASPQGKLQVRAWRWRLPSRVSAGEMG